MNVDVFEAQRPRLAGIAYGMLGSVMDAEDVVQDAYLRWSDIDTATVDSPAAYLTTVVTRLAIDKLRSAQHRRETYVGPWLPEPMITTSADPADTLAVAERLSMALLVTLERLNPVERAVLLLRDVFDCDYADIADVVDKSPANCRQIASRARERVGDPARSRPLEDEQRRLATAYAAAITSGDVDGLARILADDVVLWSDGGGKARAARHLLAGRDRVANFLVSVSQQAPEGTVADLVEINGSMGWLATAGDLVVATISFDIDDALITGIRVVLNPDKLSHLSA